MAWIGPTIAAGASLIGGMMDKSGQAGANRMNLQIAREQNAFSERMSNTAYQRAVTDMRAAGLNPMLAYQQGGASSPVGQGATMENENAGLAHSFRSVASALQLSTLRAQKENIEADTVLKGSSAAAQEANTALMRTQKEKVGNEIDQVQAQIKKIESETKLNQYDLDKLKPLSVMYNEWMIKQAAARVPELEADANFWLMLQKEGGIGAKALMFLKQFIKR